MTGTSTARRSARLVVVVAMVATCLGVPRAAGAQAAPTDRIVWDTGSRRFVTTGVYARVTRVHGGDLLMAYSDGPGVHVRRSRDNGATWGAPATVAQRSRYNYTNAELTQLANGWLLYL